MAISSDRLDQILPKLACPRCRGALHRDARRLTCVGCEARFPIQNERPILIDGATEAPRVMPETHLSNQPPTEFTDWVSKLNGWALNVGAGGTANKIPNCVEMEYSIFRHTDVVGDAHHLPFATASFDAVVTFEMDRRDDHPRMIIVDVGGGAALNIFEVTPEEIVGDRRRQGGRGAIDHYGLAVDSRTTLEGLRDRLVAAGAEIGEIQQLGDTWSLFFRDPDGMELEVCAPDGA